MVEKENKNRVFLLAGWPRILQEEKSLLEIGIKRLGGVLHNVWEPSVTHVVAHSPEMTESTMQGLASGAWLLKSSYIRACLKESAWVDEKAHLSCPSVPSVKGIFKELVAVVVLEHRQRANTYTKVIRAGGGVVLEMAGLLDLQAIKSEITHIFLDPWVTQGPKQNLFKRLQMQVISTCPGAAFLWYRFLHQALKGGSLPSVSQFDIEDEDVLRSARLLEEGLKRSRKKQIFVPSLKRQRAIVAERKEKRVRISRGLPVEVVHLDHTFDEDVVEEVTRKSDDQDIIDLDCQILDIIDIIDLDCQIPVESSDEEESESVVTVENEEYQESLRKIKINESVCDGNSIDLLLDDDSDDDIEVLEERLVRKRAENGPRRIYTDRESMVKKEKILGELSDQEVFSLQDSDLELFETFPPFQAVECGPILDLGDSSQDSKTSLTKTNTKEEAPFVESDERGDGNGNSKSLSSRLKMAESESVRQPKVDKNMFGALGRSLGSFGGEKKVDSVAPVSEHAWMEFEKMFEQLTASSDEDDCEDFGFAQLRNPFKFFLVKLRQLQLFTSSRKFPPPVALHCILLAIVKGPAAHGRAAHRYITRFLAQSFNADTRATILPLLLSSMRSVVNHSLFSKCNPRNPRDLALAWEFTRTAFETTMDGGEESLALINTLVQIFKVDLLIWRGMKKSKTFPPLILLALGGSKEFLCNSSLLVKMVYSSRLAGHVGNDNLVVVNLVALIAIVLEEMEGGKEMLASAIASEIRSAGDLLDEFKLRCELSLLRPSWLAAKVASNLLNISTTLTPMEVAAILEGQEGAEVEVMLEHAVGNHVRDGLGDLDLLLASLSVHSTSTIRSLTLPLVN